MKLWYSPASPFVRKVRTVAHEAGRELELVRVNTNVIESDSELRSRNPLGKIPALELDDGRVLFDSRVACAYLVSNLSGSPLNPADERLRFDALVLEALADGILDAAVNIRYETALRPEAYRWSDWIDGQMLKVDTALDTVEKKWISSLNGDVTVGVIAAACMLGYLDFRYPDLGWDTNRPELAKWFADFRQRDSFRKTDPSI